MTHPLGLAYEEILDEGRVIATRKDIVEVVDARFGKRYANSVKRRLECIKGLRKLRTVYKIALHCWSINDIIRTVTVRTTKATAIKISGGARRGK